MKKNKIDDNELTTKDLLKAEEDSEDSDEKFIVLSLLSNFFNKNEP